jgi:threonine/homoserine/homoserine lactone efflux protein
MFGTQDLWLFIAAGVALNLVPGQDIILIASRSATLGFKAGAMSALGVGAGSLLHVFAAAFGIAAILSTNPDAYFVIKVLGAAYLFYLGVNMLLMKTSSKRTLNSVSAHSSTLRVHEHSLTGFLYQGFLTNALNPKVALFFIAFVPQFIAPDSSSTAISFIVLGLIFSGNSLVLCLLIAWGSAEIGEKFSHNLALTKGATLVSGVLFIYFGVNLLLSSSH